MKISDLYEATVIGTHHERPLNDDDTLRVYHGTNDSDFLLTAITKGLTGDAIADRRYSYELNNNPKGLFVTPDIKVAKDFGMYVIEFHTKVSDLESPVWPNGTFTVQGQMTGVFSSDEERDQETLRKRMQWSDSEYEFIRKSSRPEVAAMLITSAERQALFMGDLNPNSIRAIWVPSDTTKFNQTYKRFKPKEIIKMAKQKKLRNHFGSVVSDKPDSKSELVIDIDDKLVKPKDNVTFEELVVAYAKEHSVYDNLDFVREIFKNDPEYYVRMSVWSDRQYKQAIDTME